MLLLGVAHKLHPSQSSFPQILVCSSAKGSSGRMGQFEAQPVLIQGISKERSQGRKASTSALFTLMLPHGHCALQLFGYPRVCPPKIILLNARASCRSAHLWLVIPGDKRGRVAGTDELGWGRACTGSPRCPGREEQAPVWCLSCSDVSVTKPVVIL